ncbi:CDP-diacylglycerol--glycerol-3-phosphate 3-phosphatidyltransferase [Insulibacter thermoxylanivorax]|uniref:CDP-diacylglycerol--glycerol-3-phosphate 3-phosphatidyltransferase n=1 Tax=Insulibacter thermoxylanivorax TaxID=2749268 RepID=A0A916VGW1_9BACL|nr:CDP-alcohol phosphatidyltransferase family protein [Insulibacter thermoxylanivorax]GFR39413.1 CDP-diacylglycerol--glycerol-3-phosphate 3-phosphatidyltransferase [Insulibacter thermoxylanivorax]
MNLPNWITLFRFVLIPVYAYLISQHMLYEALAVVIIAGLTDVLDGYIARKRQQITTIGIMLDPLADKLLMIAVIVSFLYLRFVPWEAALAIFIREIGMIIGAGIFHLRGYKTVPANVFGKLTTVLYYLVILLFFLQVDFAVPYLWCVIVLSYLTTIIYIFLQFRSIKELSESKRAS